MFLKYQKSQHSQHIDEMLKWHKSCWMLENLSMLIVKYNRRKMTDLNNWWDKMQSVFSFKL